MADHFSLDANNSFQVAAEFAAMGATAAFRAAAIVRHHGQVYQTRVRAHASGRPGPRAVTGDYRRSITLTMGLVGGLPSAIVGTNAPQGRRLEYGYVDTDSLGRSYNQPPFPHFDPPLEMTVNEMQADLAALATDSPGKVG